MSQYNTSRSGQTNKKKKEEIEEERRRRREEEGRSCRVVITQILL
jgi:hypothetical protein